MDNIEVDREAQENEMEILAEIFDSDCFTPYFGTTISGQMKIKVRMPWTTLKCKYTEENDESNNYNDSNIIEIETSENKLQEQDADTDADAVAGPSKLWENSNCIILNLKHMPPLTLHFTLPPEYPSKSKPNFTLSSTWLYRDTLSFLCSKLDNLWEENKGMGILYTWHSFLQEDTFAALGLNSNRMNTAAIVYDLTFFCQQNHTSGFETVVEQPQQCQFDQRAVFEQIPDSFIQYLINYEKEEIEKEFCRASHSCAICLSEKQGVNCILFECEHIFCKECLKEYFSIHIVEGSLDSVKCPQIDCKTVPNPYEVKNIVGLELFERYDTLLLSKTLDSMSDIINCPRVNCTKPVMFDPSEKLAKCASCGYAFCNICKMVYHGAEPCRFKSGESKLLYDKYTNGTSEEKYQLERKYGKKQLDHLVEQILSEKWVSSQSKPCPHCKVPIDKFEGCNKVTCFKCSTYFCWICSNQLDKENPYFHFNSPSSPCYNNLFTNLNIDIDDNQPNPNDNDPNIDIDDDEEDWQPVAWHLNGRAVNLEGEGEDEPDDAQQNVQDQVQGQDEESDDDSILSETESQRDTPAVQEQGPGTQNKDKTNSNRNRNTSTVRSNPRVNVQTWMGFIPE